MAGSHDETRIYANLGTTTRAAYLSQTLASQVNVKKVVIELGYEVQEKDLVCSEFQECPEQLAKKR